METLEHDGKIKPYDMEKELKQFLQETTEKPAPVPVKVYEDLKKEIVNLIIGNNLLMLSRQQALDLAHVLRKAANRIGQQQFNQKNGK